MNPKKAVKDLEKQLRKDPNNLVLRIRLAGALYQASRWQESIDLYSSVALAYQTQGRLDQAIAVCHSVLEIAPDHRETHQLMAHLNTALAQKVQPPVEEVEDSAPKQVRRRQPPRPSGMDTGSLTPGSEPEMFSPQRAKADSQTSHVGPERKNRLALPLPLNRTAGAVTPKPKPAGKPTRDEAREAATVPGTPPSRTPPGEDDDEDEAPTRIADQHTGAARARSALPIRTISFNDSGTRSSRATRPGENRPDRRATAPQRPQSRRDSQTSAGDEGRTSPIGPNPSSTVTEVASTRASSTIVTTVEENTAYDDEREVSRAFESAYIDGRNDPGGVVMTNVDMNLLPGLPPMASQAIAEGVRRYRVASGELIVREGEAGDSCFILSSGEARVLKRDVSDPSGEPIEVSRLAVGQLFGEVALLSDSRRHASVQAVGECDVLEIPRDRIQQVSDQFPEVAAYLQTFYRERLISNLVSTASFFQPLEQKDRRNLIGNFRFTRVEAGARIVEEGQRAGGFYLLVLGSVEITKTVSEHRQVLLATLGEGSYFGEMSLLRGDSARATVTAMGPTELAVLPAKNFYALVASHPILWDQVRQEAQRRELEMVQIVTGMTGSV